ncbi:uncharacterized protein SPPG_01658 [Spizellomyces punctatus DAOM BR117]|uniref:Elongation of fatty acids protein n=1 Tax=Spizellomyces punctatus (strain DAOM BR117) TaxID=645134 RepID=A0A0L0HT18_SPIPD|nr:uncharacterized protein SPPG_01658 [Spizellomyces punctatus DAOM BR117]KND04227.1 hypothetical protein SPPG_01658 [Spizellomyces punctatus DAOM BR117]|eukprot:XP_016612266.1 hypothetical protein SPPG_01658 [Spizellomyces punctatus DAOM BR117]
MDLLTAFNNRSLDSDAEVAAAFPLGAHYNTLMDWRVPVFTSAIYFFTVKALNPRSSSTSHKSGERWTDAGWFKALVVLHNAALCIFSAATFLGMAPKWVANLRSRGLYDAFCDRNEEVWNDSLFYWSWLFYLSKYYEIVDTVIILLKGRRTSILQSYHHAGAIISMWLCVHSHATATWIFVVFNSFIHTIMYLYYALTTVGLRPPGKQYLTRMQITQFLVGGSIAITYPVIPGCLKQLDPTQSASEQIAYAVVTAYLVPLTLLFVDFARRTYGGRSQKRIKVA